MKILFLDIDGVVNCQYTTQRHRGYIGIDPYMAFLIGKIKLDTDCEIVLSSSWRHTPEGIEEVKAQVGPLYDTTGPSLGGRGAEIQAWLDAHPGNHVYAIVDDDTNMLKEQLPNYFRTMWLTGITPETATLITNHLNGK